MFTVSYDIGGDADTLAESFLTFLPQANINHISSPRDFRWTGRLASSGSRALWRIRSNCEWNFSSHRNDPRNVFAVLPEIGRFTLTSHKSDLNVLPGQIAVIHVPQDRTNYVFGAPLQARTSFRWSAAEVERALSSTDEKILIDELAQLPVFGLNDNRGLVIQQLLNAIAIDLINPLPPSTLAAELMNEAVLRLMYEPAVNQLRERRGYRSFSALPRHVKQAIDYMHANAANPIRIRDVADACCVTPRTLENGFKLFKETTPIAYLYRLRLEAVRRELVSGEGPLRVCDVARRWGFSDVGRFAERYRRTFGELPSETLNRR